MALSYHSVKLIKVENTLLALIYYTLAAAILTYVIIFSIVIKKGYQETDILTGSTMVKVKGSAHTLPDNFNSSLMDEHDESLWTVFDANDLVVPPMLPDSAFITTNYIFTPNQTRGLCPGNDDKLERCNCSKAQSTLDTTDPAQWEAVVALCCKRGRHTNNGATTGRCGSGSGGGGADYCEVKAWCPLEVANPTKEAMAVNQYRGLEDWTVFIRTNVRFPKFGVSLSNAAGKDHSSLDLFTVGTIINASSSSVSQVKEKGAIIVATFEYNCDLNTDAECVPEVRFTRLDNASIAAMSSGFNYRSVERYRVEGVDTRDVQKLFGIHLLVQVYGQAGRFGVFPLFITLGSGAALLGVATVVCDVILQYLAPARHKYVAKKFHVVTDDSDGSGTDLSERSARAQRKKNDDVVVVHDDDDEDSTREGTPRTRTRPAGRSSGRSHAGGGGGGGPEEVYEPLTPTTPTPAATSSEAGGRRNANEAEHVGVRSSLLY